MSTDRPHASSGMPSTNEMAERARVLLVSRHLEAEVFDPSYIKANFDALIAELLQTEYDIFQQVQREVYVPRLASMLTECVAGRDTSASDELETVAECLFDPLNTFYLGLSNARRTRAGSSFENHTSYLFKKVGYPFDEQVVTNGKPDFLLPSAEEYRRNPQNSILFTVKRTLRERWRQVVPEGVRSPAYFLATIDNKVSLNVLQEMRQNRVILVVPGSVRAISPMYLEAPNVVDFQRFFEDYLDPAMTRWRRDGLA